VIDPPAFKAHLHVAVMPGEGALVISETLTKALHGPAYEKVVALIDGRRSADDIVDALAGTVDAARVYFVLGRLEASGHLAAAIGDMPAAEAAFWHAADVEPSAAGERLADARVAVLALGSAQIDPLLAALASAGLAVADKDRADLWIVAADDYLRPDLERVNAEALAAKRPWLLLRATGREQWLGPLFVPGETGCWRCLERPLSRNRVMHRFLGEQAGASAPSAAREALPSAYAAACHMAAAAAVQILAGAQSGLKGRVLSFDWTDLNPQPHILTRDPLCPACGAPRMGVPEPFELRAGTAAFTSDGGYRTLSAEATVRAYEHLVSPITGVVQGLIATTPADDQIAHVFVAGYNQVRKVRRLVDLKRNLRSYAGGKGVSVAQAKVSALCEAIERYSGETFGDEVRVRRAWRDWEPGEAIHPNTVMGYSDRQFAERDAWNAKGSRFNGVPERLPDDLAIDWTPVWSLSEKRHKHLPIQLLYFGEGATPEDHSFYAMGCSNGNAAGNTREEAILQGFFELVERDAVAMWWYNRVRRPGLAVETFEEPYLQRIANHYRDQYGRETWALDLTTDLGIPVFVALSREVGADQERIMFGLGCHLDARIALQRAFAEMNQMLGLAKADLNGGIDDAETTRWLTTALVANQPHLVPDPAQAAVRRADFPARPSGDFVADIQHCLDILAGAGLEMLVLDQTRAHVGLPVVKVVVPGLRHFWARFAPGRLYDVPVKMGWLERPLVEAELNPEPMFM
jgi:ribosomal protein S12 methylthiotransferase accessory factor